jgi:hypothetical protein
MDGPLAYKTYELRKNEKKGRWCVHQRPSATDKEKIDQFLDLSTIFLIQGIMPRRRSPTCSMEWAALRRR